MTESVPTVYNFFHRDYAPSSKIWISLSMLLFKATLIAVTTRSVRKGCHVCTVPWTNDCVLMRVSVVIIFRQSQRAPCRKLDEELYLAPWKELLCLFDVDVFSIHSVRLEAQSVSLSNLPNFFETPQTYGFLLISNRSVVSTRIPRPLFCFPSPHCFSTL